MSKNKAQHGKVWGYLDGRALKKEIRGSKHLLKKPAAICYAPEVLENAQRAGAIALVVEDTENGVKYQTTARHFNKKSFEIDRGYGRQVCMLLSDWQQIELEQPKQTPTAQNQPSLFGVKL